MCYFFFIFIVWLLLVLRIHVSCDLKHLLRATHIHSDAQRDVRAMIRLHLCWCLWLSLSLLCSVSLFAHIFARHIAVTMTTTTWAKTKCSYAARIDVKKKESLRDVCVIEMCLHTNNNIANTFDRIYHFTRCEPHSSRQIAPQHTAHTECHSKEKIIWCCSFVMWRRVSTQTEHTHAHLHTHTHGRPYPYHSRMIDAFRCDSMRSLCCLVYLSVIKLSHQHWKVTAPGTHNSRCICICMGPTRTPVCVCVCAFACAERFKRAQNDQEKGHKRDRQTEMNEHSQRMEKVNNKVMQ